MKEILKAAVITVSDKAYKGIRADEGGPLLASYLKEKGFEVVFSTIVPDEKDLIKSAILSAASKGADLILTTGGTGFSERDVTPEATLEVIQKVIPGIPEFIRLKSSEKTLHAILSRAVCGIYESSVILNLPGKPKGALESLELVLEALIHGIKVLKGEITEHA